MASRFASRAGSPPRRRRAWSRQAGDLVGATTALPVATNLLAGLELSGADALGGTVRRILLDFEMVRTAGAAANPSLNVGITVAPDTVEPVDINPSDATQFHQKWMWWERVFFAPCGGVVTATWRRAHHIDVGAMRKLNGMGDNLWLVVAPIVAADVIDVTYASSSLILLP